MAHTDLRGPMKSFILVTLLSLSTPAFAIFDKYEVPKDEDVMFNIGAPTRVTLPRQFKIFDWNVEKASGGEAWVQEFAQFSQGHEIILIQEAASNDLFLNALKAQNNFGWTYFISWTKPEEPSYTGITMGSPVSPLTTWFTRSPDTEPISNTPKLAGYQTFSVEGLRGQETLLVVNIHAINFVSTSAFMRQINQVMENIAKHAGPVVFIGDMNTWSSSRLEKLREAAQKQGLKEYDFDRTSASGKYVDFDRVFVRGLKVSHVGFIRNGVKTSDHFPISVGLEVP